MIFWWLEKSPVLHLYLLPHFTIFSRRDVFQGKEKEGNRLLRHFKCCIAWRHSEPGWQRASKAKKKKAEGKMIRQVYCQLIRGLIAKAAFSSVFSRAVGLLLSLLASRGLFLFLLLSTHMCPLRNLV